MDTTVFLGKLFGLFYLITGVAMLVRTKEFGKVMDDFLKNAYHTYFTGFLLVVMGLTAVLVHNVWEGSTYVVVITVLAWLVLLKGVSYMILPSSALTSWVRWFEAKNWYTVGGVVALLIGLYLSSQAFGLV
jgi:hypothetical protein